MVAGSPPQIPGGRSSDFDRIWDDLQRRHRFPLSVMLAVTERCNLRCAHCFVPPPEQSPPELRLEQIERLLDELAGLGVLLLTLSGGEPALRDDLEQIVAAATRRRFAVKLKTNGTLLTDERIDALVEAGLMEVHLSLHDDRPEGHDAFVGESGAWERALAVLQRFRSRGVNALVACNATGENVERIPRLVDLCEAQGFAYSVDPQISPRSDGDREPCRLRATREQLVDLLGDRRLYDGAALASQAPRAPDSRLCGAGVASALVRPNGDVLFCPFLPQVLGNVLEQSFERVWLTSPIRRQLLGVRWRDLTECADCDLAWACTRCPGRALAESGDIRSRSPADCLVARARASACGQRPGGADNG